MANERTGPLSASPGELEIHIQRHPYLPYVPDQASILILGSAPPWRFCLDAPKPLFPQDVDYYYGSHKRSSNLFWEVMFRVWEPAAKVELEQIRVLQVEREARTELQSAFLKEFLARHGLGIADILLRFERRDKASADARIRPLEFTDLMSILKEKSHLAYILCTSKQVFHWLGKYLASQGLALVGEDTSGGKFTLMEQDICFSAQRKVRVLILPSPSPVGRVRFPNHQAFVEHLTLAYQAIFDSLSHP